MRVTLPSDLAAPIYVAGHRGLAGSAIMAELTRRGHTNVFGWTSQELDLRDSDAVRAAIEETRPAVIVMAAARVGGILANAEHPVDFLNDNLLIQTSLFEAAHACDVDRLLFLGSSCIYPKMAPQPIPESALLTGPLESTNQAYATAKIAGLMAVRAYRQQYGRRWISAMPTNLYGPGDNFDLRTAHVLPALIRRFHEAVVAGATEVSLWGTGRPRREFLHVDDMARAAVFLLANYDGEQHVNVGTGKDVTIADLAALIAGVVGYEGDIGWDTARPDGTPRKVLDTSMITAMGWRPTVGLRDGVEQVYEWFTAEGTSHRRRGVDLPSAG